MDKPTKWKTMGGNFTTHKKANIEFQIPEFSTNKTITWKAHVDEFTIRQKAQFDLIIGSDLMSELKLDLCYSTQEIKWDGLAIPMKNRGMVSDLESAEIIYHTAVQSPRIMEAEERHRRILDADYSKVNIDEYVDAIEH